MAKKQKKTQSKTKQKSIPSKKYWLVFVVLIGILVFTLFQVQHKQTYLQHAETAQAITGCMDSGDPGNAQGVGKFCTQGGGQCQGLQASICSADIQLTGNGICSMSCNTDADCGTGAICYQDTLGKGCEPIACEATPTPTTAPTVVPSPGCLGPGCVTPGASPMPTTSAQPTQAPTAAPAPSGTGGGNILQLLIGFIMQIVQFFINLFKSL